MRTLTKLGPTIHHRRSFAPVRAAFGDGAALEELTTVPLAL